MSSSNNISEKQTAKIQEKAAKNEAKVAAIPNKGTGAGGAGTNKTGLSNEKKTSLHEAYDVISETTYSEDIVFKQDETKTVFIASKQSHMLKCFADHLDSTVIAAHGCKNPDDCYVNMTTGTMFIIEKKFQRTSGSVCEKIQTAGFKRRQYAKLFPSFNVEYMYCLSDWFKENCPAELQDLTEINIPVFWGDSNTYADDIVKYIISHQ